MHRSIKQGNIEMADHVGKIGPVRGALRTVKLKTGAQNSNGLRKVECSNR